MIVYFDLDLGWRIDESLCREITLLLLLLLLWRRYLCRVNLRDIHVRGTVDYIPPLTIEHGATGLASSMKTTNLLQAAGLGAHSSEVSKRLDDLLDEDPSMQSRRGHLETLELQKAGV